MKKNQSLGLLCAAIGLALAQGAAAQDQSLLQAPPTGISSVPFDLLPPGARSLGLAGAFTAVADDATSAEANPAGLTQLTRPEVSLHGRRTSFDLTNFNGDANYADTYDGQPVTAFPLYTESDDDTNAVAFASYVHPFDNGAVSIYYQNTGKIRAKGFHTGESTDFFDQFTFTNNIDLNVESIGLSGAYRFNDLLAVGGSLRYTRLKLAYLDRTTSSYLFDLELQDDGSVDTTGITDEASFQRSMDDSDNDITFNLGVLFNPGGRVSVGVVYKDGGSFDLTQRNGFGILVDAPFLPDPITLGETVTSKTRVELPDVLNVGVAFRPTDQWLLSFDAHYTRYSELPALPGQSLLFGAPAPNAVLVGTGTESRSVLGRQSNATTYHFGVERVFVFGSPAMMGMNSLALRAGVFSEKDLGPYSDDVARALEGIDTRDEHYTVGLGTTFGDHVQVDLAAEFSDDTDNIVLSAIYRF